MMRKVIALVLVLLLSQAAISQTTTTFGDGTGEYGQLFEDLRRMMVESKYRAEISFDGKERTQFVQWIRDHVHVMKAMKYVEPDMTSFWQFYMETQTPEGMYFDYYYPLSSNLSHRMKLFDKRYWQVFPADSIQMHRLPIEADLEYLMVEGAYYIWQSTGDDSYILQWLPRLEKGLNYSMTDPLRWSTRFQLVKRGYTLDTWDFMQLPMSREEYTRQGYDVQNGIFNINDTTRMGIMHGDNSGLYAACRQLEILYTSTGNNEKAGDWRDKATKIRERTNQVCWNGSYYAHFVPDDPMPEYLSIDQQHTLSLSNPYDINRGLPDHAMAASIIRTYRTLRDKNSLNSFAEWFGIYPPVEPHFADYKPGSYMNGGVNTIVAGELAKAAFQHGYEAYAVDILDRLRSLVKKHHGDLPVSYKPDGTVDEGIPDNWGQAAVMSALVEGLAGVVDEGKLFEHVELAPRWLAAGKDHAEVTVVYAPSGKNVSYSFDHQVAQRNIRITVDGDPKHYTLKMLLPPGIDSGDAKIDGIAVPSSREKIEGSTYVVVTDIAGGRHVVDVKY